MKGVFFLLFTILLLSSNTCDSELLMAGTGTSDFGLAIIGILGALLMRNTKEKK